MYIFLGDRHAMMRLMPQCDKVAELGVHAGGNAAFLNEHFNPKQLELIDAWDASLMEQSYTPFEVLPDGVGGLENFAHYFGGDPRDQATMDAVYRQTVSRFEGMEHVNIVKQDTHTAAKRYSDNYFDLIYVDASHQYEYVLNDLKIWEKKLSPTGYMVLNDCISSPEGRYQNLGVLEAVTAFLKAYDYVPLALTMTGWSDIVLTRRDNPNFGNFLYSLLKSKQAIEVPQSLLYSFQAKKLEDGIQYFSFGS